MWIWCSSSAKKSLIYSNGWDGFLFFLVLKATLQWKFPLIWAWSCTRFLPVKRVFFYFLCCIFEGQILHTGFKNVLLCSDVLYYITVHPDARQELFHLNFQVCTRVRFTGSCHTAAFPYINPNTLSMNCASSRTGIRWSGDTSSKLAAGNCRV